MSERGGGKKSIKCTDIVNFKNTSRPLTNPKTKEIGTSKVTTTITNKGTSILKINKGRFHMVLIIMNEALQRRRIQKAKNWTKS